ncbi:hypothetical protein NECAME_00309 [Necator americanus]|uniref:Tc3 transposase DNA binding domain-containing protein n=1 Tax=Necator americanus TaxID=51031 RepID=W2TD51_NECAM|nr:hypothetical protein NECAME_00309 [Necator americanus]ETN78937.1 hypothetical protein NECAME_00309 [Necator americanus]
MMKGRSVSEDELQDDIMGEEVKLSMRPSTCININGARSLQTLKSTADAKSVSRSKSSKLSAHERAQDDSLHAASLSDRRISAQPGRSHNCIKRYLNNTEVYKEKSLPDIQESYLEVMKVAWFDGFQHQPPASSPSACIRMDSGVLRRKEVKPQLARLLQTPHERSGERGTSVLKA